MKLNFTASVSDFFKHPKWMMNALLGAVCMLIPLIGPVVLSGWIITQFWARGDKEDPAKFPEFDFNHFMKYLNRGLWPFLVQLVAGLAIGFVLVIVIIVAAVVIATLANAVGGVPSIIMLLMFLVGIVFYVALMIGINLIMIPLSLKATLTQDFAPAFDLAFVKNFLSNSWKDVILCGLFMFALGLVLMIAAVITFGLGAYLLMPVVVSAWQHLQKQLYLMHLERGGIAVTKSDKLNDLPPALSA